MKNRKKYLFIVITIIAFILMFILNNKTLMVSDDYPYQFLFAGRMPTDSTKLISNPLEIFVSMYNHWNLWGGRVVPHYLLQLTFLLKNFNFVNSIMFVLLGLLIYLHAFNFKDLKPGMLLLIYSTIFLFAPQPDSTMLWKSGSANYLWPSVLFLCMSLIYKGYYDNQKRKNNLLNAILIFILGLLVGCCSENASFGVILIELLFIILYLIKKIKVPKWAITGIIGTIIGYIILVAAPGNYIRAEIMYPSKSYDILSLIKDFFVLTELSYEYLSAIIIATVISLIMIYKKEKDKIKTCDRYIIQAIFLIYSLASIYSLVMSPAYPERSWFFGFVYLVVVLCINVSYLDFKLEAVSKLYYAVLIIAFITTISEYSLAYYDIDNSQMELEAQIAEIEAQIAEGKEEIVVHSIYGHEGRYNAFTNNGYLTAKEDSWFNSWMAEYYGVDSIIAIN